MIYYRISGKEGNYCIFVRDTEAKYPTLSQLFNIGGSPSNVRSWKTKKGLIRFVEKNYPEWTLEESSKTKL